MKKLFIGKANTHDSQKLVSIVLRYSIVCFIAMIMVPTIKIHTYFLYYLFNSITSITPFVKMNDLMPFFGVSWFMGVLTITFVYSVYVFKRVDKKQTDNSLFITGSLMLIAVALFSIYLVTTNVFLIFVKVVNPKHLQAMIRQYVFKYILLPSLFISVSGLILSIKYYTDVIKSKSKRSEFKRFLEYYRFLLCLILTLLIFCYTSIFLRYLYGFGLYFNSVGLLNNLLMVLLYISIPVLLYDFLIGIKFWIFSYK